MDCHLGFAEDDPAKLKHLTAGCVLSTAGSVSLQHGTAQFKEKEVSKPLCTNPWVSGFIHSLTVNGGHACMHTKKITSMMIPDWICPAGEGFLCPQSQ